MKLAIVLLSILFSAVFLTVAMAFPLTLELQVTNSRSGLAPSANPAENVVATFTFPDCLTPTVYPGSWNESSRELIIEVGNMEPDETRTYSVDAEAADEGCDTSITGSLTGDFYIEETQPGEPLPPPEEKPPMEEEPVAEEDGATEEKGGILGGALGGPVQAVQNLDFLPAPVSAAVETIRKDPTVAAVTGKAVSPVTVAAGAVTSAAVAVNAASVGSQFFAAPFEWLRVLPLGFSRRKKRLPWGQVINGWTRKPVQNAVVSILDAVYKRVKETQTTDRDGRFGFLASPGRYYLSVSKGGFEKRETDPFEVGADPSVLQIKLEIFPKKGVLARGYAAFKKTLTSINDFLSKISPVVLAAGAILSLVVFIIIPTVFNLVVLIVYVLAAVLHFVLSVFTAKSYGTVVSKESKTGIPLAVVRLFNLENSRLVATRVTDDKGRFNFLVLPGNYYLTCSKGEYKEFSSPPFAITKAAALSQTFELEKIVI